MKNGNHKQELDKLVVPATPRVEITVDNANYLSLMSRYNKAEASKESEFEWVSPGGQTYQLVTRYAHYLLEAMAVHLGLVRKGKA